MRQALDRLHVSVGWFVYRIKCTILLYADLDLDLRECWAYSTYFRQGFDEGQRASVAVERELDAWLE